MYGINIVPGSLSQFQQIYIQLRERILDGRIPGGARLPPTRSMALELKVARSLVTEVMDQLKVEGFIKGVQGSGNYVESHLPYAQAKDLAESILQSQPAKDSFFDSKFNFAAGIPDPELFPRSMWNRCARHAVDYADSADLFYAPGAGKESLRRSVRDYLLRAKGIHVSPDQIFITQGTAGALELIAKVFPSKSIILEDPLAPFVPPIFQEQDWTVGFHEVDQHGLEIHDLVVPENGLIYTTPSHQFPIGGSLPMERRKILLQKAAAQNALVLEDDYDGEFRFDTRPLAALQVLDPKRVLYMGSFSKILSPALHLGYLVVPKFLVRAFGQQVAKMERIMDHLQQNTMARFLSEGFLEKHLRKSLKIYRSRRNALVKAIAQIFGPNSQHWGWETGLSTVLDPGLGNLPTDIHARLLEKGVYAKPVSFYSQKSSRYKEFLALGFGLIGEELLLPGLRLIAEVLGVQ